MTARHARHLVVAVVVFSLVALRAPVYAQQPLLDDLRTRADQGEAEAQFILGTMYESGTVLIQNYVEAARWHRRAAEQGYALSFLTLGRAYCSARGVPQDFMSAHMWFNLAAAYLSGEERDTAIAQRDLVDAEMTSAQRAEAQYLAREWQPRPERPNGVSTQQGDRPRISRGGPTVGTPGVVAAARDRFGRDVTTADRQQISVGFGVGRSSGLNSLGVGFGFAGFGSGSVGGVFGASVAKPDLPVSVWGFGFSGGPIWRFNSGGVVTPHVAVRVGLSVARAGRNTATAPTFGLQLPLLIRLADRVSFAIDPSVAGVWYEGEVWLGFGVDVGIVFDVGR